MILKIKLNLEKRLELMMNQIEKLRLIAFYRKIVIKMIFWYNLLDNNINKHRVILII